MRPRNLTAEEKAFLATSSAPEGQEFRQVELTANQISTITSWASDRLKEYEVDLDPGNAIQNKLHKRLPLDPPEEQRRQSLEYFWDLYATLLPQSSYPGADADVDDNPYRLR